MLKCVTGHVISQPTSFVKIMLEVVFLAQDVRVSDAEVLVDLPIAQLGVELVGRGVQRVPARVLLVAVVVVENGRLADGHADDGAAVLVCVPRAPVAVAALGSEQHRGDVVDLVSRLGAGALLRDAPSLAPAMAGVQDEGEEEDQEQEGDEASLKPQRGEKGEETCEN